MLRDHERIDDVGFAVAVDVGRIGEEAVHGCADIATASCRVTHRSKSVVAAPLAPKKRQPDGEVVRTS